MNRKLKSAYKALRLRVTKEIALEIVLTINAKSKSWEKYSNTPPFCFLMNLSTPRGPNANTGRHLRVNLICRHSLCHLLNSDSGFGGRACVDSESPWAWGLWKLSWFCKCLAEEITMELDLVGTVDSVQSGKWMILDCDLIFLDS